MQYLRRILDAPQLRPLLWLAHVCAIALLMWATRNERSGDHTSYMDLAHGILVGKYSLWWWMPEFVPDTFRTPGFPLYLATIVKLFGNWKAMWAINAALYLLSLHWMVRIIARFDDRPLTGNLALVFLLPLVNVPYYITQVLPEIPALASVTAIVYLVTRPGRMSWMEAIALGALYGFSFQCKPIYLLLPPALAIAHWWYARGRSDVRGHAVALSVFAITLLPYTIWNKAHHGVWSTTPLEGGGGVMHFGIWAGAIPNYQEHRYWSNFTGDEIIDFVPTSSVPANIATYEAEWDSTMARIAPLRTHTDSLMELAYHHSLGGTRTYSAPYTLEREQLLKQYARDRATADFGYTLAYKSWSALRLWVIGVQRTKFKEAGVAGKLAQLYPTITTFVVFMLTVLFSSIAFVRKRLSLAPLLPVVLHLVYFGLIHIPFVIQVRYTTAVRPIMMVLLALALAAVLFPRKQRA